MSTIVTQGIRITVESRFIAERSREGQFAFAYTVEIKNEATEIVQLISRHWIVTDGDGNVQEVRGDGVVGEQPILAPGQAHTYQSWSMIPTPHGTMHGTYQMLRVASRETFDARIAPFSLTATDAVQLH